MKLFKCDHCGQPVYFENTYCVQCNASLGFDAQRSIALNAIGVFKIDWLTAMIAFKKFHLEMAWLKIGFTFKNGK